MTPYWRIIKTENGHEPDVARTLANRGHEIFLPLELRVYRQREGKHRAKGVYEALLIPRRVFVLAEFSLLPGIRAFRHVTGFERDAEGFPEIIPSVQMETFREAHAKWLADEQTKAVGGKAGRGAKQRAYKMQEGLEELKRRMSGGGNG